MFCQNKYISMTNFNSTKISLLTKKQLNTLLRTRYFIFLIKEICGGVGKFNLSLKDYYLYVISHIC